MNIVIRSNFCSEVKAQRRKFATRKIAIGALALSVVAAAGYWWVTYVELSALRGEHAAKMATDAKLDGELEKAREKAAKREAEAARRDAVLRYAASRTNLAPMLERLFAATPANVEISGLRIKAPNIDTLVVEVHGRSAGAQPRLECDKCRLLLANAVSEAGFNVTATFSKLEEAPDTIHFEECEYPAADFVIEMKLKPEARGDEKHKRLVLAGIGVVAVIYCYFALLISPELAETARLRRDLDLSRQRVMSASAELKQLEAREHAALAEADRDGAARDLLGTIPTPFMVTTPPVLDEVTEQHELPSTKVKLFMMQPFKGLPDHALAAWNMSVSEANALRVGEVIADLENRFPLGRLSELQVGTDSATGTLNALIQFQTLVRP